MQARNARALLMCSMLALGLHARASAADPLALPTDSPVDAGLRHALPASTDRTAPDRHIDSAAAGGSPPATRRASPGALGRAPGASAEQLGARRSGSMGRPAGQAPGGRGGSDRSRAVQSAQPHERAVSEASRRAGGQLSPAVTGVPAAHDWSPSHGSAPAASISKVRAAVTKWDVTRASTTAEPHSTGLKTLGGPAGNPGAHQSAIDGTRARRPR